MPDDYKRLNTLEFENGPARILGRGDFLEVRSLMVRNLYESGETSPWYRVETVYPPFYDAVVLVMYDSSASGGTKVLLRRAARPAAAMRTLETRFRELDREDMSGALWELPAGGVEPGDLAEGGAGIMGRALAEAWEEGGFKLQMDDLVSLGPAPFSAPAICPERLHYFAAEVNPKLAEKPPGDGHPMEEGATLEFLDIKSALEWCRTGRIVDLKSEVGLRRFKEWYESR